MEPDNFFDPLGKRTGIDERPIALQEAYSASGDRTSCKQWTEKWFQRLSLEDWVYVTSKMLSLNEHELSKNIEFSQSMDLEASKKEATLELLQLSANMCIRGKIDDLIAFFSDVSLGSRELITASNIIQLLEHASQINERKGNVDKAIYLRKKIVDADPFANVNNLLQLIAICSARNESFEAAIYIQLLVELYENDKSLDCRTKIWPVLRKLISQGEYDLFFELVEVYVQQMPAINRPAYYAVLSQIAKRHGSKSPQDYENLWDLNHLCSMGEVRDFSRILAVPLDMALGIEAIILEQNSLLSKDIRFSLMSEAMTYYGNAGNYQKMKSLIESILDDWTLEDISELGGKPESFLVIYGFLFRVLFVLPYITDDINLLRRYQKVAASSYSQSIQQQFPGSLGFNKVTSPSSLERPLRVGYLSMTFCRHSVGFLSHATLGYHNPNIVETYLYSYFKRTKDGLRGKFERQAYEFRDLYEMSTEDIVDVIRSDDLDILVYLDATTSGLGCNILALRVAPIQMSWLGGDSPGLPEIDYFLVDPFVLPREAESSYREKLLRIPSYAAVDDFEVASINLAQFREVLEIPDDAVVYMTAAVGYKRNPECIACQLEIIRDVPRSILIIKGLSDIPTVASMFLEKANQLGVRGQLRFLDRTNSEEMHRSQLNVADIILDTFPYSGATHSFEALWRGIPVLTVTGRHYYNRMTYALLCNIGEMEDCIALSSDEYIRKGIALGCSAEIRSKVKQRLQDTSKSSFIWNSRYLARSMEAAYRYVVHGGNTQDYAAEPSVTVNLLKQTTSQEWNQAGLKHYVRGCSEELSVKERYAAWEAAWNCWFSGIRIDPYDLSCSLNQIFVRFLIGETAEARKDAVELLNRLFSSSTSLSEWRTESENYKALIWKPEVALKSLEDMSNKSRYIHVLSRWLAERSKLPFALAMERFWSQSLGVCPSDFKALFWLGLHYLMNINPRGFSYLESASKLLPSDDERCQSVELAYSLAQRDFANTSKRGVQPFSCETADNNADISIVYEGYKLYLEPTLTSITTINLLSEGCWFEDETVLVAEFLKPGMRFIDVGANVGVYTFLAARRVGLKGRVIAVEPTSCCVRSLNMTVEVNQLQQLVTILPACAGEECSEVHLIREDASVLNRVVDDTLGLPPGKAVPVECISLDSLMTDLLAPISQETLLKVSVEGTELQVLQGARELIESQRPHILIECRRRRGEALKDPLVIDFLSDFNYQFFSYFRGLNELRRVNPKRNSLSGFKLLAVHQDKIDALRPWQYLT